MDDLVHYCTRPKNEQECVPRLTPGKRGTSLLNVLALFPTLNRANYD